MVEELDIATPTRTQAILNRYGLRAKKKFGQNFLTDLNILDQIVNTAVLGPDDDVVEIGPGIGGLTEQLARASQAVLAFEIDPEMVIALKETLSPYTNVEILNEDILAVDIKQIISAKWSAEQPVKIVANLPYYITTPILISLLQAGLNWSTMVVMMQREVADRLAAEPGTKEYGVLTIMLAYYAQVELAVKVPARAFNPAPNVDSAVVKLTSIEPVETVADPDKLFKLVKITFAHRRKSLWNNLGYYFGKEAAVKEKLTRALSHCEIEPGVRAEKLTLADFIHLYQAMQLVKLRF